MPVMSNLNKRDNDTRVNINGISSMHYIRTGIASNKIEIGQFVDFYTENGLTYTKSTRSISKENIVPSTDIVYEEINLYYWQDCDSYITSENNNETTTTFDLLSYNGIDYKLAVISDIDKSPSTSYKIVKVEGGVENVVVDKTMKSEYGVDYSGFGTVGVRYSVSGKDVLVAISLDNHTMYFLLDLQLNATTPIIYVVIVATSPSSSYIAENSSSYKTISGVYPSFFLSKTNRVVIYDNINDLFLNETLTIDEVYGDGSALIYNTINKYKDITTVWGADPVEKKSVNVYKKTSASINVNTGQIIPYTPVYLIDKTDEVMDNLNILRISSNRYFLFYTVDGILKGFSATLGIGGLVIDNTVYTISDDRVSKVKPLYASNNTIYIAYTLETNVGYDIAAIKVNEDNTLSPYISTISLSSPSNTSVSGIWIHELEVDNGISVLYQDTNGLYADIYEFDIVNSTKLSLTRLSSTAITSSTVNNIVFMDNDNFLALVDTNKIIASRIYKDASDKFVYSEISTVHEYSDNYSDLLLLNKANKHTLLIGTSKNSSVNIHENNTISTTISARDVDNVSGTDRYYIPLKEYHYLFIYKDSDNKLSMNIARYNNTSLTLYEAYTMTETGIDSITGVARISDNNVAIIYKELYDIGKYQYQIQIVSAQYRDTSYTITPSDKYPFDGIVKNKYSDGSVEVIIPYIQTNGSIIE